MKTINRTDFIKALFALLKETFEGADTDFGTMYLDQNTALFATLEQITAEQASAPLFEGGTTVAAHCEHLRFYIEFLNNYLNENFEIVDWKESWKTKSVNEAEWTILQGQLQKTYQTVIDTFKDVEEWTDFKISGALGILTHTAYHLSAIRQTLKIIEMRTEN